MIAVSLFLILFFILFQYVIRQQFPIPELIPLWLSLLLFIVVVVASVGIGIVLGHIFNFLWIYLP